MFGKDRLENVQIGKKSVPSDWISACEQNTRCSGFGQVSREFLWEGVPISARNRKKSARNQVGNQLEQGSVVHETKSEFVEGRGERCTKSSRNSSGKGESGRTKPSRNSSRRWRRCRTKPSRNSAKAGERRCTKPSRNSSKAGERRCTKSCRNSSVCGRRPPRHCQRVRHRTAGERGERLSSRRRKRRCRKRKKYPTQVGYFYMKTDFDVVCFQKVSCPIPL